MEMVNMGSQKANLRVHTKTANATQRMRFIVIPPFAPRLRTAEHFKHYISLQPPMHRLVAEPMLHVADWPQIHSFVRDDRFHNLPIFFHEGYRLCVRLKAKKARTIH